MTHTSGATAVISAAVGIILWTFFFYQVYRFDRFRCLNIISVIRGTSGRKKGFLRLMTFSYLLGLPFYLTYFLGLSVIKYHVGFTRIPMLGTDLPTPHQLWPNKYQHLIMPLFYCFAAANACSAISSIEDVCFWIWVMQRDALSNDWIMSWPCRAWFVSTTVVAGLTFAVPTLAGPDSNRIEAGLFLTTGLVQLIIQSTMLLGVVWGFDDFLEDCREAGVPRSIYGRLRTFHSYNKIRIGFKMTYSFACIIPSIALLADTQARSPINHTLFSFDIWPIVALVGWSVSCFYTLLIFFPSHVDDGDSYVNPNSAQQPQVRSLPRSDETHVNPPLPRGHGLMQNKSSTPATNHSKATDFAETINPLEPAARSGRVDIEAQEDIALQSLGQDSDHSLQPTTSQYTLATVDIAPDHDTGRTAAGLYGQSGGRAVQRERRGAIRPEIAYYRTPLEIPYDSEDDEED